MAATLRIRRKRLRRRLPPLARLSLETLETRLVPAFTWTGAFPAVAEVEPNDTILRAQDLSDLTQAGHAGVIGNIANSATDGGGIDWYQFTLTAPADVHLATLDRAGGSPLVSVLSLYNSDPFDFSDRFDLLQHRLLAQDDGAAHGGDAAIDQLLGPGTYFVAVSGSGNRYFHPLLPNSGFPGSTGDYGLAITTTDAGVAATDGPAVLTVDPAPGSTLARSPYVIRVDLSSALDPGTFLYAAPGQDPGVYANPAPGQTVELRFSPTGDFSPGQYSDIPITANFTPNIANTTNELQIVPAAPLAVGFYQLFLAGNSTGGAPALADLNGVPLGTNSRNPQGADYTSTFWINGIDGVVGAQAPADTVATAHDLKDITNAGLVQVAGAIGVDPTDPSASYSGANVEVYHFTLSGPDRYAFSAEVFARRIGSPLDPAVTLLQRLPDGTLRLVGLNNDTNNNVVAPDGMTGLLTNDAALFVGLTQGDYFLVVSGAPNFPDPTTPWQAGPQANGSFDPTTSHSTDLATLLNVSGTVPGIGPYVLNLAVTSDNVAPTVIATTPADGTTLTAPPTGLTVQFSKPMNLLALANQAFQQTNQGTVSSVYILRPSDGRKFFPRVQPFSPDTNTVPFLMLDGLANGTYQLHLSGPLGLTDFAGNPLTGNDPSGDYVVTFQVQGPQRGVNGDPLQWAYDEPSNTGDHPQDLGVLFPLELAHVTTFADGSTQDGVTITRNPTQDTTNTSSDTADYYQFQVLQDQKYVFTLNGLNLPPGVNLQFTVWDNHQNLVIQGTARSQAHLIPGTYLVSVTGWQPDTAPAVAYQLSITLWGAADNPPPLTYGAGPAVRFRLATNNPPSAPTSSSNPPPTTDPNSPPPQPPTTNPPATPPTTSSNPSPSNPPPAVPPANPTPPPAPPASTPPSDQLPAVSPPPVTPPPVTPPATNPPAGPPAVETPPASPPVVRLPANNPTALPRLTLPNPSTGDAPPEGATTVAGGTPSPSTVPTASSPAAGAPAPAAPAAASSPASFSGIPSGLLLALGAGPVGGVQTYTINVVSPTPERVAVQGPNPVNVDGLVRITTLTRASQLSGNDSRVSTEGNPVGQTPGATSGAVPGMAKPLLRLLQQALDSFFGMRDWLLLNPLHGHEPAADGSAEENLEASHRRAAGEALDDADEAWVDSSLSRAAEPAWGGILAALGTVALIGSEGPRRPRPQPPVRFRRWHKNAGS